MPALVAASWVYAGVSNAVRSARSADPAPSPVGVRVISVGNLEAGGCGKTPFCVHVLSAIAAAGGNPVYISRGFGGLAERLDVVTVVAPRGDNGSLAAGRGGVRYLRRETRELAAEVGDEGAMVATRLPGVPMVICRDKRRALETAVAEFSPGHAVLDDAFQSWGVPRDVDVVLVDGTLPLGNGWLLPAGDLREPADALGRADYVGANGVETEGQLVRVRTKIWAAAGARKPVFGIRRRIDVVPAVGDGACGRGATVAAVSAIAKPEAFERQLADAGFDVAVSFRYPDHYRYTGDDAERMVDWAARRGINRLVTTEKDWAKLAGLVSRPERFALARLALEPFGDTPPLDVKRAAE